MYDFHLHSNFSMDSKASMESMVLSAIENNLKSICFTDHVDLESTSKKIDFLFRADDYFKNIKKVKYKYMDQIEILGGVEIGMQPHLKERYDKFIDENPFDFVIMSIHGIAGKSIAIDNILHEMPIEEVFEIYYREMYESVRVFDNYDVLGHMDYIDRYIDSPLDIPNYKAYYEIISEILKLIIDKGKGLEVNTAGIRRGLDYFNPKPSILNMYKELGGEILTIGSDAHSHEHIGYNYRLAERHIKDLGFKYIYLFKGRKKFPIKI